MNKTWHLLLIEDDVFLGSIYKTKFEQQGFRVSVADNGEDGLADAKRKKPDIILLDVLLPRVDGFEVLHELKQDKLTASIPVVLLTNLGQKEDITKGLERGAVDYLIKAHFKPSETVAVVKRVLAKK